MSERMGAQASFRRALHRPPARESATRELMSGEEVHTPDVRGLPPAVQERLMSARTESLLDLLQAADARVGANRLPVAFAAQVLVERLGGRGAALTAGVPEWALDPSLRAHAKERDNTHLFVGWVDRDGAVEWEDRAFHPDRPADIAADFMQRIRTLDGVGGIFGRTDDGAVQARAERLRHTMDKWRGRSLRTLGAVAPERVSKALGAVASPGLRRFLEGDAQAAAHACMLALEGKNVVLLSASGDVCRLSRTETKHLALVGLLPRHWFLPLHWWKDKKVQEQEQEKDDARGKAKVYQGRYDDEQEVGLEEEKDEYGG